MQQVEDEIVQSFGDISVTVLADLVADEFIFGEIARVLKPGGVAVISDFRNISEYMGAFTKAGLDVRKLRLGFATFPPMRILIARKARG